MASWTSCAHGWRAESPGRRLAALVLLLCVAVLAMPAARADAQRDPELRDVVAQAIDSADCFPDKYDSAVWYTLMEPKLRRIVKDDAERLQIAPQRLLRGRRVPRVGPQDSGRRSGPSQSALRRWD